MFCCPIDNPRVRDDRQGRGEFGASRIGHLHYGVDFLGEPGAQIMAPSDSTVQRWGVCYAPSGHPIKDRLALIVLEFSLGWWKLMYMEPSAYVGDKVEAGQPVGVLQNVAEAHGGGMKNHLHCELILRPSALIEKKNGRFSLDPSALFAVG